MLPEWDREIIRYPKWTETVWSSKKHEGTVKYHDDVKNVNDQWAFTLGDNSCIIHENTDHEELVIMMQEIMEIMDGLGTDQEKFDLIRKLIQKTTGKTPEPGDKEPGAGDKGSRRPGAPGTETNVVFR